MTAALIILSALVITGLFLYVFDRPKKTPADDSDSAALPEPQCCGLHLTCDKTSLIVSPGDKIEYYDDEELDAYIGIADSDYSEDAIEQFRDVLLTLMPDDIAGWAKSIRMRGIELPSVIRDELLMIVAEARLTTE